MEFTLLDNGKDSLKKAKESINSVEELHKDFSYHHLKDAVIFLNHGIEILLKYILASKNESLIFTDISIYLDAKKALKHKKVEKKGFGTFLDRKKSVFNLKHSEFKSRNKLRTITLLEALERIEYLCDISIPDSLIGYINLVNKFRNDLTHHSISVESADEDTLKRTLKVLYTEIIDFFESQIPGITEEIDQERYELTQQEWEEAQEAMQDYEYERSMNRLSIDEDEY